MDENIDGGSTVNLVYELIEIEIDTDTAITLEHRLFKGLMAKLEVAQAKLSERKTVHEWLNQIGAEDTEANGKPMCLLRRLAVELGIQPYSVK